jgi:hypothetical protein
MWASNLADNTSQEMTKKPGGWNDRHRRAF